MNDPNPVHGLLWRVSVAAYNRVLFPDPQDGTLMLALERRATMKDDGGDGVHVWSQPFGGGVHILDPVPLQEMIGEIQFDCEQSRREQDFRILIHPSQWRSVKQYCLHHLGNPDDPQLESLPHRELVEEFAGALNVDLKPDQFTVQPAGFVMEDSPLPTDNVHAPGHPTVRLYRIFEIHIVDDALCRTMLAASRRTSDRDLGPLAMQDYQSGGKGHVNTILTLPLDLVTDSYLALPPEMRFRKIVIENHELDESVLAVLGDVDVPQYQRV